jgi:hypothetical protein
VFCYLLPAFGMVCHTEWLQGLLPLSALGAMIWQVCSLMLCKAIQIFDTLQQRSQAVCIDI